jgi:hypothetical protein
MKYPSTLILFINWPKAGTGFKDMSRLITPLDRKHFYKLFRPEI